jgi:hypothetical protein
VARSARGREGARLHPAVAQPSQASSLPLAGTAQLAPSTGNGEPPPPAARRPRAGVALTGASRAVAVAVAVAVAAAPAGGEVSDGGGWKRNGGVLGDKIVSGTHLRFLLTVSQLIRSERRASSGLPFVSISVDPTRSNQTHANNISVNLYLVAS